MTATEGAAARPAVLDLPPEQAAPLVAAGKPCPGCGAVLEPHANKGSGLDQLFPQDGARCKQCELEVTVPHRPLALAARSLLLLAGGLAAIGGLALYAKATAPRVSPALVFQILSIPWAVWVGVELKRRLQRVGDQVAAARRRWEQRLEERDKGIAVEGAALLRACKPGATCPVCEKAPLEGMSPNALWSRGALSCPRCRLELPFAPTPLGFAVGMALAGLLVVVGGAIINAARSMAPTGGNAFLIRLVFGGLAALGGIYVGFLLQGSGNELAEKELEDRKRRHERRKAGLPARDDEDEPAVWFQENLEAVIVAVILALVIRHFVMEAFVIPTGSMAPTLYGDHFELRCKRCQFPFAYNRKEGEVYGDERRQTLKPLCPLCGATDMNREDVPYDSATGGNKILVNKFIYQFTKPERWQVIVFKWPKEPTKKNFIKRLLGLPGETIRVDLRGDVWIKPPGAAEFRIAHKPREVQDELWLPVYDSRYVVAEPWWKPDDAERWQRVLDEKRGESWVAKPGAGETAIEYGEVREIHDYTAYNPVGTGGENRVGDLRVRARVTPAAGALAATLALVNNHRVLKVTLPVGSGVATVTSGEDASGSIVAVKDPTEVAKVSAALAPGVPAEVVLSYADRELWLTVNGDEVGRWGDDGAPSRTSSSSVRLGAVDGEVRFEDVKIDRDVFYVKLSSWGHRSTDPHVTDNENGVEIPAESYFCMGDNSANSQDSREWGFVREPHLIGRAFLVFWPLWHVKLIR